MPVPRILLVDDDPLVLELLDKLLESQGGYEVTTAANVPDALKLISSNVYDVLLSDLHMPGAGDGLTVVSAMHHANPKAVTMLLSSFPEMDAASRAILLQADQILVKPIKTAALIEAIQERLATGPPKARTVETVASVMERTAERTIQDWFQRIQTDEVVMAVPLPREERIGHLPQLFRDLVLRLRSSKPIGSKELVSVAAAKHGLNRRQCGYTAAMLVEESRMLQVSVFQTLQNNLSSLDFSLLLTAVMTIADEIDSQLSQAMTSYIKESVSDSLPA